MQSNFRTFLLMMALTLLFIWIGGIVGGKTGSIIALIIAAGMNFYSYWFSDKMVLSRYKANEIGPDHPSGLYQMVEKLANNAQLPMPKVYITPEQTPNAFATGRNPQHAAVAATQGILRILSKDELEGVMAHELAHVKHRDILTSAIAATFAGALATLGQIAHFSSDRRENPMAGLFMMILAPIAGMVIRMTISRVREFAADKGGAEISGKPLGLATALYKLQNGVQQIPMITGRESDSHMFIINPFFGGMQKLFSTHPSTEDRIKRLEEIAGQKIFN
ncbi:MAG: zinc metalloprotease HtpX [Ignavibacteriae bacterium]|nr:zinc metalloprotease HtpX [Ignavibacteriota bacterium]